MYSRKEAYATLHATLSEYWCKGDEICERYISKYHAEIQQHGRTWLIGDTF